LTLGGAPQLRRAEAAPGLAIWVWLNLLAGNSAQSRLRLCKISQSARVLEKSSYCKNRACHQARLLRCFAASYVDCQERSCRPFARSYRQERYVGGDRLSRLRRVMIAARAL